MAGEVKWIKIVTDIFDDEKMLLIEGLPSADSIIVIWFKLLCLAGKNNNSGVFLLNDTIPYTDEMLATIFRRDINTVRLALQTFNRFGMVEIINDTITIPNWSKHQTLDAYEKRKERDRLYQKKKREEQKLLAEGKQLLETSTEQSTNNSSDVVALEEDKEEEVDKELRIDNYIDSWNSLGLNKLVSLKSNTNRYKQLNARINDYGEEKVLGAIENIRNSSFLKGQNNKGWTITFDWFIKPNNFLKVLEGNYDDKKVSSSNKPNGFNNFEARKIYSDKNRMSELENKLLGWED